MFFIKNRNTKSKYDFLSKDYICFNPEIDSSKFIKNISMVEIEIFSFCNRKCWFCPNNFIDRNSKNIEMDKVLYVKILKELEFGDYDGFLSFSRYNEPFSDQIIYDRTEIARNILPQAKLISFTNGDYLTHDVLRRIERLGLDYIFIQIYENFDKQIILNTMNEKMNSLKISLAPKLISENKIKFGGYLETLYIEMQARDYEKVGANRGGTIKILSTNKIRTIPCMIPFYHIYIDYNGNVVPCCNIRSDIEEHKQFVWGNIVNDSLMNIYFSRKAIDFRKHLFSFEEKKFFPCQFCSFEAIIEEETEYVILKDKISEIKLSIDKISN